MDRLIQLYRGQEVRPLIRYRTIVADPPWPYDEGFPGTLPSGRDKRVLQGKRTRTVLPYKALSIDAIAALPVGDLADPTGCRLFLWVTNKYLRQGFDILGGWGFRYTQTLVWDKLRSTPFIASIAPNSAEFILVGVRGKPARTGGFPSAVIPYGRPNEHAHKPDIFIDFIEQTSPPPYVELFARRHRLGWDVWGDQSANTAELAV